ncbi:hypothetical protein DV495_002738 [Geotrichum candidum]|uniref:Tetratricopeptide SHNi-TPR domain-containing protein n=1 Tax=Geotrichum candidum TaxID=1173061 RepID=A0A0J9XFR0_GEOCN|nr:hypothetical protein DV452_001356 [Geotrichum candidum]KAI9212866.1 hypothetical protein DS838_002244 [Geotrichum bryndzae]KAF5128966.1 hypothetical protein DV495_002738 [Geotrichum candidum]KAF7498630.1 hypothetical protein DV113_003337 [Geotrichum candidum]KAI8135705.1 hypothetical protein DUD61_000635 [Geotrichum candidum]
MSDNIESDSDLAFGNPEIKKSILDGSKHYAFKEYELAAEKFSEASELHSVTFKKDNPTILFLYGRAVFQIGVSKSDVLGGNASKEDKEGSSDKAKKGSTSNADLKESNPNIQLADDVEDDDDEEEDAEEPAQDDFELAWELLDISRALFLEQVDALSADTSKNAEEIKKVQTKLAEVYDLLGEVSLESENFPQAAEDLEKSLDLKKKIYPVTSSLISEAHFKLSLAYEFCVEDPVSKDKAIHQMELAIKSVKERLKESATDDASLVKDLEARLEELKKSKAEEGKELEKQKADVLMGLIGQDASEGMKLKLASVLGEGGASAANDISSLVKKKKPKRKIEDQQPLTSETSDKPVTKKQKADNDK